MHHALAVFCLSSRIVSSRTVSSAKRMRCWSVVGSTWRDTLSTLPPDNALAKIFVSSTWHRLFGQGIGHLSVMSLCYGPVSHWSLTVEDCDFFQGQWQRRKWRKVWNSLNRLFCICDWFTKSLPSAWITRRCRTICDIFTCICGPLFFLLIVVYVKFNT